MLNLMSVSALEVVIGDVADKFKLPRQRVHTGLKGFESNLLRPLGHHVLP